MRNLKVLFLVVFLTACSSTIHRFELPEQLNYLGERYVKVTDTPINEMRNLLYLPASGDKNPENWQRAIMLFVDKNSQKMSLNDRLRLRQNAYQQQKETYAKIEIHHNELQSQVIYPPTERFPNYQLEVTRGIETACGYQQMQIVDKITFLTKNLTNLTKHRDNIAKLALQFSQLHWWIKCK